LPDKIHTGVTQDKHDGQDIQDKDIEKHPVYPVYPVENCILRKSYHRRIAKPVKFYKNLTGDFLGDLVVKNWRF
jgi:hypothetical protein